jgi:hypothetical protein
MVVAFLTGRVPVRKHLNIMGPFDCDHTCRFYRVDTKNVHHLICFCEAFARQHYDFFGKFCVEPKDISMASLKERYLLARETGLENIC